MQITHEKLIERYKEFLERRLAAEHAGDKKVADSLKSLLNGTYGKLYAPDPRTHTKD